MATGFSTGSHFEFARKHDLSCDGRRMEEQQSTDVQMGTQQHSVNGGKMRAAVYRGASNISLETVPVPKISEGEILLRVHACGVCGTDLKKIEYGLVPPPRIFGHEIAGTIVETGSGVTPFPSGDRVTTHHHIPCRKVLLLPEKAFFAMRVLSAHRHNCGI